MTESPKPIGTPPADDDDVPAGDDEQVHDMAAMRKARRDAATWRTRCRELEEELGAAVAREAVHHRNVVIAAAKAAGFIDPGDFLAAHPDVGEFVDEEFRDVVPDRVAEAAAALLEAKPHLGRPVGAPPSNRPLESLRSAARAPQDKTLAPTWATALRGGA